MSLPSKAAFGRFIEKNPALCIAEFRYFLSIRFGLIFALNLQSTIIYYWVYHITNDKLSLGLVGLAEVIPAVCVSLFSGHVVDLNEKRKMVLLCIVGYIFLALGLALLTLEQASNAFSLPTVLKCVYALVFVGGAIRAFYGPSGFALSGLVVPRELYPNATSWSSMAWQMGAVCGPLVGGFLIAWSIEYGMFTILGILLLLLIPILMIKPKPFVIKEKEPILTSLTQGIRFVAKTPALLGAQCLDMFSVLFGGAVALLPVFQKEILKVDEYGFGILRAAPGLGALCTMACLAFIPLQTNPGKKLFIAVTGFALSIIGFGLSTSFLLSFFMLMLSGIFDAVSVVIRSTILQLLTPDHMRGRVSAVNTIFISSSNELGDFESGVMAHWLGTVRAVVTGGCITLGVVAVTFASAPQLRNFNFFNKKEPEPVTEP